MSAGPEFAEGRAPGVAAVLINWRQPRRTIEAVRALARQTVRPLVIVVDNGSGDDSVSVMKEALPDTLILEREENGGFGAGCNTGIERAMAMGVEYIWLLNNDAVPDERCLEYLVSAAHASEDIGAVGACVRDPTGAVMDHAGGILHPMTLNSRYTLSEEELAANRYAWITGASMFLSVAALKKVGAFDGAYFMYCEDVDMCCRLRAAGFRLAVAKQAIVEHEAGTSSNHMKSARFRWHLESQVEWVKRNYSRVGYGVAVIFARHLLKSVLTRDWERLAVTMRVLRKDFGLSDVASGPSRT